MDKFEEFLNSLGGKLKKEKWPNVYLFKFIVPSKEEKINEVTALFDEHAEISTNVSTNAKYTSISIKTIVVDVEEILHTYRRASKIEGIISL